MRDSRFGLVCRGASLIEVDDDRGDHFLDNGLLIEDGIPAIARMRGSSIRRWLVDCGPDEEAVVTMLHDTPAHISLSLRRCVSHSIAREISLVLRCMEPLFATMGHAAESQLLQSLSERLGSSWQDIGGSHGDQLLARGGDLVVVSALHLESDAARVDADHAALASP